jgi:hypothetical protein
MAQTRPVWRQAIDRVERTVGPKLEELIRTEQFAIAVGLATRANRTVRREIERTSRRLLHFWNLPSGSDITRVMSQLAELQRQVRDLSHRIEEQKEASRNGRIADPVRPVRSRSPRP